MRRYLLAHDIGTSGNKATLFTTEGALVRSATSPYPTSYFNDNWAEQDAEDWWEAVCSSTRKILRQVDAREVAAVSFSGQMMGCLCVDRRGKPLRKAIIWADQRSTEQVARLSRRMDPEKFYRITGHRLSPSYSLGKLLWVKEHERGVFRETHKMLNAKDFVIHRLTGRFVTDCSDASGTNLLDLQRRQWSDAILEKAEIDEEILPETVASTHVVGEVAAEGAEATGLAAGTPIVCGAGDGMCAAVGAGCIREGVAYNYLGSSSWIAVTTRDPLYDPQMRTFTWAHSVPGFYSPCGTMQAAGGSLSWLKEQIAALESQQAAETGKNAYGLINEKMSLSPAGARGLLYLPYLLGERSPRWNPLARGAFIGLKMEHRREDVFRAVMEGIALNLNIIYRILKGQADIREIIVIGGLAAGKIERQILADVYGTRVLKPTYLEEATAMGAAVTAGVGAGIFGGFEAVSRFLEIDEIHEPNPENHEVYQGLMPLFDACYHALEDVYEKMAEA